MKFAFICLVYLFFQGITALSVECLGERNTTINSGRIPSPRRFGASLVVSYTRNSEGGTTINKEELWVVGGSTDIGDIQEIWKLDLEFNSWTQLPWVSSEGLGFIPSMTFDGQRIFIFGGAFINGQQANQNSTSVLASYDPSNPDGVQIPLSEQLPPLAGCAFNYWQRGNLLVVHGGILNSFAQFSSRLFSINTASRTASISDLPQLGILPSVRMGHTSLINEDKGDSGALIIFGGYFEENQGGTVQTFSDTWSYDFTTATWTEHLVFGPSSRVVMTLTKFFRNYYVLYGGLEISSQPQITQSKADFWMFDADNIEWKGLPFSADPNPFSGGCIQYLGGPYAGFSPSQKSLVIFGGIVVLNQQSQGVLNGPKDRTFEVSLAQTIDELGAVPPGETPPVVAAIFVFAPLDFTTELGTIVLPPEGAFAFAVEDGLSVQFLAPPGQPFRAEFQFLVEGIDFDPLASWSFSFIFKSADEWLFFARTLNGTEEFIGDSNGAGLLPSGFLNATVSSPLPLSDFIFLQDPKNPQQPPPFGSIFRIIVQSARSSSNSTRDAPPSAEVDTMSVSVCTNCQPVGEVAPTPSPDVPPTPLGLIVGLSVGITGGVAVIGGIAALLIVSYRKKSKRLSEDTELPDFVDDKIAEISPVTDVTIERKIGGGNFGEVYLGHAFSGSTKVALKRLKNVDGKAFLKELEVLVSLKHPNTVQFYGIYTNEKKEKFLVTEYIDQGSVLDWVSHGKGVKASYLDKLKVILDAAKGMAYLHANKIIHRDLSARNLLIDSNQNTKVCDFGLASTPEKIDLSKGYSETEKIPVRWSPPEVLSDMSFSFESDVWSFGVTVYEVLTNGAVPYEDLKTEQVYTQVMDGSVRLVKPSHVSQDLWKIVMSCFEPVGKRPLFPKIVPEIEKLINKELGVDTEAIKNEIKSVDNNATKSYDNPNTTPYGEGEGEKNVDKNTYLTSPQVTAKQDNIYEKTIVDPKNSTTEDHYQLSPNSKQQIPTKKQPEESVYELSPDSKQKIPQKQTEKEDIYGKTPSVKVVEKDSDTSDSDTSETSSSESIYGKTQ